MNGKKEIETVIADDLLFRPWQTNGMGVFVTKLNSIVFLGFYGIEEMKTMNEYASRTGLRPLKLDDIAHPREIEHLITPLAVQQTLAPVTPVCPYHGQPMYPSKKSGGHYCRAKNPDGSYCKHTV